MIPYSEFRPSRFDGHLEIQCENETREDWLVGPCTRNRDSDVLTESNFAACLVACGGEGDDCEVRRFGHWANGWFEIILVRPGSEAAKGAEECASSLEDYCILNEEDYSERETQAAVETWQNCYSPSERIAYIRAKRSQFDFHDFADMMGSVRGKYFGGDASELLAP